MGTAWKIFLVVVMVGALAAAKPSPQDAEVERTADPVEETPAKQIAETLGPVNPKRPPNKKDNHVAETRSDDDRRSNGGLFEDIFNIPIKVLEAVRDLIQNRGQYYAKKKVNEDASAPDVREEEKTASPS